MAARHIPGQATAEIVVKAESHQQLDQILLALHNAVSAHQHSTNAEGVRMTSTPAV